MKLAIGAGSGGGISGTSTTGAGFRGRTAAAGFLALGALRRAGFFGLRTLLRFAFAAFPADFRAERAFAMTAYATVARLRRQPKVAALKCE